MRKLEFLGEPVAQGRPIFTGKGSRPVAIDPPKSRNAKLFIKAEARSTKNRLGWTRVAAGHVIAYRIEFVHALPKSWSKAKKERFSGAFKASKPDLDNLTKLTLDALTDVLFVDDNQLAVCYGAVKRFANYDPATDTQEKARTIFEWEEIPNHAGG